MAPGGMLLFNLDDGYLEAIIRGYRAVSGFAGRHLKMMDGEMREGGKERGEDEEDLNGWNGGSLFLITTCASFVSIVVLALFMLY